MNNFFLSKKYYCVNRGKKEKKVRVWGVVNIVFKFFVDEVLIIKDLGMRVGCKY